ncbi:MULTISPECIES: single-stranded DNA-binding protein, partial [Sphingobacterium]|uniref:single-stranded DNA-binding protein n=1 Tax=Sphingobacterium TaxID=28453 RepID=UPI00257D7F60
LNENYRNHDGSKVQKTTYIDCAYWNRPKITEHLTKGLLVEVTGFPSARTYQTKSGEHRGAIDFRVDRLDFLGKSKSNTSDSNNINAVPTANSPVEDLVPSVSDDDLPF